MKNQKSEAGSRKPKRKEKILSGIFIIACVIAIAGINAVTSAAEKEGRWEGVDKAVVERIAKEQGREASAPLINTEQGDLMLFLFLTAGAAGGFIAGYSYRMLTERTAAPEERTA